MYYNKAVFFFLENGKIVACNSDTQEYYELESSYFQRLLKYSSNSFQKVGDKIEQEFLEGGFLVKERKEECVWQGDPISFYAHNGTRILSQHSPILEEEEFCQEFSLISQDGEKLPPRYLPSFIEEIKLPSPNLEKFKQTSLLEVLNRRKTSRNFEEKPIELDLITSLLYISFGPIHGTEWVDFKEHNIPSFGTRGSSPSATGLQGCDAYLVVQNVKGLKKGIYFYSSEKHSLYLIEESLQENFFSYATGDQFWSKSLSAGIFIVHDMRRTWVKDRKARGYLAAYLEAGHISQTLLLCATALNLHTWVTGTFRDDFVNKMLHIENSSFFASFFVGLGFGSNNSIPDKFIDLLNNKKD